MDVVDRLVLAQRPVLAAVLQEEVELGPGRIFRRAEQAGHREGAAGVGPGGAGLQRLVLQPAAQEAGHEGVAGAQHVEHLDRETFADNAVFQIVADRAVIDDAAHGAALEHDCCRRQARISLSAPSTSSAPGGNQDFLFGADDQIAIRQRLLHLG